MSCIYFFVLGRWIVGVKPEMNYVIVRLECFSCITMHLNADTLLPVRWAVVSWIYRGCVCVWIARLRHGTQMWRSATSRGQCSWSEQESSVKTYGGLNRSVCHFFFKNLETSCCSVQFSSRWYLYAWKGPYVLHPVSQTFSQHCLWNGSSVRLIDDGSLSSFRERLSSTSSFHASLLMEHNYQPEPVSK